MTYLDYLPDTPYADLPAATQAEISATEYAQLQVLGTSLSEPKPLPNALSLALAAKVLVPQGPSSSLGNKTSGVHAGWRLAAVLSTFALGGMLLYSAFAKTPSTPTNTPTPQPIERIVVQHDTIETIVRDTVTLFKTRVKIQEVHDTIYLRRSVPIAEAAPEEEVEPKVASKSLQQGLDWQELTVRGAGLE